MIRYLEPVCKGDPSRIYLGDRNQLRKEGIIFLHFCEKYAII